MMTAVERNSYRGSRSERSLKSEWKMGAVTNLHLPKQSHSWGLRMALLSNMEVAVLNLQGGLGEGAT